MDIGFEAAQREDVSVTFTRPLAGAAKGELAHLPGVLGAEALRVVPVRLRSGHHARDTAVTGIAEDARFRRVVEWPYRIVAVPEDGVLVTDALAKVLDVKVGDLVTVEVLEGERRVRDVRVSGVAREILGLNAYATLSTLHALLDETDVVNAVLLSVDPREEGELFARLKRLPFVAAVSRRSDVIAQFRKQSADSMRTTSVILTLFGCAIAVGVVYNHARIALSVRSRDLASLRILGFTRREISAVLLGELAAYVILAIVPGLVLGRVLVGLMFTTIDQETYRMPAVVTGGAYAFAVVVTACAAIGSALIVRRQLDRLDLVGVLKARE